MSHETRIVADADVLASDLLVDGSSRAALDTIRAHSWLVLVASPTLLSDAHSVIKNLACADLADAWEEKIQSLVRMMDHPASDHPAIASAYTSDARHILSLDPALQTASAGVAIRTHVETSVKHPDAFMSLFDPATYYETMTGDQYPGPDRDPHG